MTQDPDHQYMGIKNDYDGQRRQSQQTPPNANPLKNGGIIHKQTLFDNASEPLQISEAGDESMYSHSGYNTRNSFPQQIHDKPSPVMDTDPNSSFQYQQQYLNRHSNPNRNYQLEEVTSFATPSERSRPMSSYHNIMNTQTVKKNDILSSMQTFSEMSLNQNRQP